MSSHFLAYMSKLKYIKRWNLMRNIREEDDLEHTAMVALIAHALATIRVERYNGEVDMRKVLEYALFHEAAEVITGDLASPIKYFNPEINQSFKQIEKVASEKLLSYVPHDLTKAYGAALFPDENTIEWRMVKAADKLSAYIKCIEESRQGSHEFERAESSIRRDIEAMQLPEIKDFMDEFIPSFMLPLDGLN